MASETDIDFDALLEEALGNRDARTAYVENGLRRRLAVSFDEARELKGMSVRQLARAMGTSLSQVQRLLHSEVGGSLTLRTVCRAADALDLTVSVHVRSKTCEGHVVPFGRTSWEKLPGFEGTAQQVHVRPATRAPAVASVPSKVKAQWSASKPEAAGDRGRVTA